MKLLIDTNIALTYLSGRDDPYKEASGQILKLCAEERIEGYLAFHSLSTIWYVTRRLPDELRREWLRQLCLLLTIIGADNEAVLKAVDNPAFTDFEDNLQDCCAQSADADYIVTGNVKDFQNVSAVRAVTPVELLEILSLEDLADDQ